MLFMFREADLSKLRFTSRFGWRTHPINGNRSYHRGIDIAGPTGTPILSPADGVVTINGNNPSGYGFYLVIHHPDNNMYTLYAHLHRRSNVNKGARVKEGQEIGIVGTTGASTGPHLHFEIHVGRHEFPRNITVGGTNDPTIDPAEFYQGLINYAGRNLAGFKVAINNITKPSSNKNESDMYTVQRGDSLSVIASKYPGVSWKDIAKENDIKPPSYIIRPGQLLEIPGATPRKNAEKVTAYTKYTVKAGDSLSAIASRYNGVTWQEIAKINGVAAPGYIIHPGQRLKIPNK